MTDLAELRMFLWDENMRLGTSKERLKRKLTSHVDISDHTSPAPPINPSAPSNPTANLYASNSIHEDTSDDESDKSDKVPVDDEVGESGRFSTMAQKFRKMAEEDDTEIDKEEADADRMYLDGDIGKTTIATIFDYNNSTWIAAMKKAAMRGMNEELEFYELADLDAVGEVDDELGAMDEASLVT